MSAKQYSQTKHKTLWVSNSIIKHTEYQMILQNQTSNPYQLHILSHSHGKNVHPPFNSSIFWLVDCQYRMQFKTLSWYLRLATLLQSPSPFSLEIRRIAINLLYFPCPHSDYLSPNLIRVHRDNSNLGFLRRHCWSVRYLSCWELFSSESLMVVSLTSVYQNFHTRP